MKLPLEYYCKDHPGVEPWVKNCGLIRPKDDRPIMRKLQYVCWQCGRKTKTVVRRHRPYQPKPKYYFGLTVAEWCLVVVCLGVIFCAWVACLGDLSAPR